MNRILSPYGKEFTWHHKAETMGSHTLQLVNYLIKTFELPMEPQELQDKLAEGYKEVFPQTKFLPGDSSYSSICNLRFLFSPQQILSPSTREFIALSVPSMVTNMVAK